MPKELWTPEQTEQFLGIKIKSLYQKVYRVELGTKSLRFDPEEIEKLIEAGRRKAFALEESNNGKRN